jgi:predicted Zn-dependent protease
MKIRKFKFIFILFLCSFSILYSQNKLADFLTNLLDAVADTLGLNPEKDLYRALNRSSSEWDDDILLSEQFDTILKLYPDEYPMIEKSFLQQKCQEIAEKIIKQTPYPDLPIQVKIINNSQVNAFTTGGKYIYIHSGLLSSVSSEDALAFIISHEIGHIMGRHPKRGQKGETFAGLMIVLTKQKHLKIWN